MELPNHAKQVLLQLNQQRAKGFLCDVIVVVENALFRAHKNILAASSIYFKSLVLHDNLINLDTEMVNPAVFRQVLDFIYTGKLLSCEASGEQNFTALLTAASYLQLHDLAALCRKKLKRGGRAVPGKPCGGGAGVRPLRAGPRIPTAAAPAGHKRFPSAVDCDGKPPDDPLGDKLSDEEPFAGGGVPPPRPSSASLRRSVGKSGSGGDLSSGSGGDQELGLDLSKKSPSDSTATEEVSPNSLAQGSPQSACASTDDSAPNPLGPDCAEPMETGGEAEERSQTPRKSSRQVARKKEWPKKEGGVAKGEERAVPNGVIAAKPGEGGGGSGSSFASDHSFQCKEEEEEEEEAQNGRDHSEESGPSDGEGGGRARGGAKGGGHSSANYVFRQEGFEPAFGDNLYVCIPCGKGFPSSEQLNAHVETHTEEELYIKEEAAYVKEEEEEEAEDLSAGGVPAAFASAAGGPELRPYKCSVCGKGYKDPATLRQHEKSHWLTRPFPCNICGKMFTQRGTMTRHMRSHLGLKPFACEECGMRFTRQYRLTEHMRVHSGEKPYECQLCGGKFTQQRNLISHLRMHTSPS